MTNASPPPKRRELVLLTHAVPQWIGPDVESEFDLRMLDLSCDACRHARVMITPGPAKLGADILGELPALEYIAAVGSGIEGIDITYAARRGIRITNSAIATAEDVADHTLAITLALYARIISLDHAVRTGNWPEPAFRRSLRDLNVGIVGLGAIGAAVARRLAPFGCSVKWTGPRFRDTPYDYVADLAGLAEWADILIVAARADASNAGMINANVLDRLGAEGLLVNVSRGSIVDEDALIVALKQNRLGGAALDVFRSEPTPAERWKDVPNIVLSPHIGGYALGVQRNIQKLLRENLHAFFDGSMQKGIVVQETNA